MDERLSVPAVDEADRLSAPHFLRRETCIHWWALMDSMWLRQAKMTAKLQSCLRYCCQASHANQISVPHRLGFQESAQSSLQSWRTASTSSRHTIRASSSLQVSMHDSHRPKSSSTDFILPSWLLSLCLHFWPLHLRLRLQVQLCNALKLGH